MSFWLNHGVSGEITWPSCEVEFFFGRYRVTALPSTAKKHSSLHIDLETHGIDHVAGASILSQILSLASWIEDAPAKLLPGWAGNPAPVPVPRYPASSPSSRFDFWPFNRQPIGDPKACQAVAICREARTLDAGGFIPYAALGYYKMLEIKFDGATKKIWVEDCIRTIVDSKKDVPNLDRLVSASGSSPAEIGTFLFKQVRNAVAHTRGDSVNPDDIYHVHQISSAINLLRAISRQFISNELKISSDRWKD